MRSLASCQPPSQPQVSNPGPAVRTVCFGDHASTGVHPLSHRLRLCHRLHLRRHLRRHPFHHWARFCGRLRALERLWSLGNNGSSRIKSKTMDARSLRPHRTHGHTHLLNDWTCPLGAGSARNSLGYARKELASWRPRARKRGKVPQNV